MFSSIDLSFISRRRYAPRMTPEPQTIAHQPQPTAQTSRLPQTESGMHARPRTQSRGTVSTESFVGLTNKMNDAKKAYDAARTHAVALREHADLSARLDILHGRDVSSLLQAQAKHAEAKADYLALRLRHHHGNAEAAKYLHGIGNDPAVIAEREKIALSVLARTPSEKALRESPEYRKALETAQRVKIYEELELARTAAMQDRRKRANW